MRHLLALPLAAAAVLAMGTATASAQDAWPVDPGEGNASRPVDLTDYVLTPDQLEFWNPSVNKPRVVSPYGNSTKIVCTGYRAYTDCWQADSSGKPRKLDHLFNLGVFGSVSGVPAQSVFVYPGHFGSLQIGPAG